MPDPRTAVPKPSTAPTATRAPVRDTALPQGTLAGRKTERTPSSERRPVRAGSLKQRQVRRIVLNKAQRALVFHLGDASTFTERLLWFCDFPPGTYPAKPQPGTRLDWVYPQALARYVAEGGRGYSVLSDRADRARNPGTFEGVPTFDFQVLGDRLTPEEGTGNPDLDAALASPELRRFFALGGRRLPDSQPDLLPPDELLALIDVHQMVLRLTGLDWELLDSHRIPVTPGRTWAETKARLGDYLGSGARATALADASLRDARLGKARSEVDVDQQLAAVARLSDAGDLYDAIKLYRLLPSGHGAKEFEPDFRMYKEAALQDVQRKLGPARFHDVQEFDAAVRDLRVVVGRQARLHALISLKEGERVLRSEAQRYGDRRTLDTLATELRKLKDPAAKTRLQTEYPILRDEAAFRGAQAAQIPDLIGGVLRQNIQAQLENVGRSRQAIEDDPDLVFHFNLLMEETFEAMGLRKDAVQARVIRDAYGVPRSMWEIVNMVMTVLCIAAGPLGWIGWAVNLAALGLQIHDVHEQVRLNTQIEQSTHVGGTALSTKPEPHPIADAVTAVGLVTGGAGVFHLPAARPPRVPRVPETPLAPHGAAVPAEPTAPLTAAAPGPHTQGGPGAAGIHDESFAANRHYNETTTTPLHPATPAEARPANGQHALDNSLPVERDPADPAAPAQRIGVDVQNQQLVVLTRVGQRVQGDQVVGGIYRGRVAKWSELTPQMRKTLSDYHVQVDPSGQIEVPDTWVELDEESALTEKWASDRHHNDTLSTPHQPPTPVDARPVDGQRALDNSVPVGADPNVRIGLDDQNQQFVVLTRVGQRVRGGSVVGGTYRGRVVAVDQLTPEMQAALADAGLRTNPFGRFEIRARTLVPGRSASIDPYAPKVGDLDVTLGGDAPSVESLGRRPGPSDLPGIAEQPEVTVRITVQQSPKVRGTIIRRWDRASGALIYENDEFTRTLPRMVRDDLPIVPNRGTPLETHLTLGAMNLFEQLGADFSVPRVVRLEDVVNVESVAMLAWAQKVKGLTEELALLETHTVQYAENAIIQRGGRITSARITKPGTKIPWGAFASQDDLTNLARKYPELAELPPTTQVQIGYHVELTVEPVTPAPPAANPPETP